jgi:hypothetical protein
LFTFAAGARQRIAAIDATTGLATADPGASSTVYALAQRLDAYAGGGFTTFGAAARGRGRHRRGDRVGRRVEFRRRTTSSTARPQGGTLTPAGRHRAIGGRCVTGSRGRSGDWLRHCVRRQRERIVYALQANGTALYAGGASPRSRAGENHPPHRSCGRRRLDLN